jgi:hypothetical protein
MQGTWGTQVQWVIALPKAPGPPAYYERKDWNRDAEFVYNHIVCPPMVLWLGEASGISQILVRNAKKAALGAPPSLPAQSAAIRKVIPWNLIEGCLTKPSQKIPSEQPTK